MSPLIISGVILKLNRKFQKKYDRKKSEILRLNSIRCEGIIIFFLFNFVVELKRGVFCKIFQEEDVLSIPLE